MCIVMFTCYTTLYISYLFYFATIVYSVCLVLCMMCVSCVIYLPIGRTPYIICSHKYIIYKYIIILITQGMLMG
jgi:hypothetical protein